MRTALAPQRIDAPHQSTVVQGTQSGEAIEARLEFVADLPALAYADLQGFERIWLIFAFHRSQGWKPQVKPPRGGPKRGVHELRNHILYEVQKFTGHNEPLRDQTIVVLEVKDKVIKLAKS